MCVCVCGHISDRQAKFDAVPNVNSVTKNASESFDLLQLNPKQSEPSHLLQNIQMYNSVCACACVCVHSQYFQCEVNC